MRFTRRLVATSLLVVAPVLGWALPVAASETGDRVEAERILTELAAQPDAATLASREIDSARRSLERARGARDAKDSLHGEQLERLARVWAETARDTVKAAKIESEVSALQTQGMEGKSKLERDRVLLEETISRRGRAEVELKRVEKDSADRQRETIDRDGKHRKPKPPAPVTAPAPSPGAKTPAPKATPSVTPTPPAPAPPAPPKTPVAPGGTK